jgi:hypothetical protein
MSEVVMNEIPTRWWLSPGMRHLDEEVCAAPPPHRMLPPTLHPSCLEKDDRTRNTQMRRWIPRINAWIKTNSWRRNGYPEDRKV